MNDRIDRVLAALPSLLFSDDHLGARALLEELYDAGADDLLADLCGAEQAAARWGVTERRARAHIARLHEKYGVGRQFGGTWLLRRQDIDEHLPNAKYQVKE
jgi:hypothetical protein